MWRNKTLIINEMSPDVESVTSLKYGANGYLKVSPVRWVMELLLCRVKFSTLSTFERASGGSIDANVITCWHDVISLLMCQVKCLASLISAVR